MDVPASFDRAPAPALLTQLVHRHLWVATFVPLVLLYLWTLRTNPFDMSPDPIAVVPSALQLAQHGTPRMPHSAWPSFIPWFTDNPGNTVVSARAPGLVLLATPVYWLFRSGGDINELPASALAAFITAAAMASLAVLLTRFVSHRIAFAAALIGGTATTTWAVSGTALWPHGPDQFLLVTAMAAVAGQRYARAGWSYAVLMLIRPTLAVAAAAVGLAESWRRRRFRPAIMIGAFTAVGCAVYWAYCQRYFAGATGASEDQVVGAATHGFGTTIKTVNGHVLRTFGVGFAGDLVSPGRGILIGSPFLLLLIPGLRKAWRVAPTWARSSAMGGVLYILVELKCEVFDGGQHFWSYRYPIPTVTLAAPLLLLAWREWTARSTVRKALFEALVIVSVTWQAVGAVWFRQSLGDKPWTFIDVRAAYENGGSAMIVFMCVGALAATGWFAARVSGRTQVFDVARTDGALAVSGS